ncbi:heme ABC exporter ATP-binding protein CcmA [Anoxybacillus flavithermus]|jgi:heme ABC exporter ATP-binding subunit CcmA|uniref:ABC heme exporter, ATPase subunit n=1 Tax=Anoxybacillus flavithermus AK1 TaxID=1297581 RepID=M8E2N6_9BACL|nr:heme ABC exporter ATP-binding protein CcmA [Anoxybacillus flavithermus]EMT47254.1 ABC heme exporter, ATPase subunit [Anoxybacillus flavithermus AK1]
MIVLQRVQKKLGTHPVLRHIDMEVKQGDCFAIVGPNGAGKTTLLKICACIHRVDAGNVYWNGQDVYKQLTQYKKSIGWISHQHFLYESFTPVENLRFYSELYGIKNREETIQRWLRVVDLYVFKDIPVRNFSKGMKQRLSLARALLHEPNLLLLDEPFTGLDQDGIQLLFRLLREEREKQTAIMMVTHDFSHIEKISNKVAFLHKGKIAVESMQTKEEHVREIYNTLVDER